MRPKIAGTGTQKTVHVELCGMKNINKTNENIKILGVHISYNKKIEGDLNFNKNIKNLCNLIKLWLMTNPWKEKKHFLNH